MTDITPVDETTQHHIDDLPATTLEKNIALELSQLREAIKNKEIEGVTNDADLVDLCSDMQSLAKTSGRDYAASTTYQALASALVASSPAPETFINSFKIETQDPIDDEDSAQAYYDVLSIETHSGKAMSFPTFFIKDDILQLLSVKLNKPSFYKKFEGKGNLTTDRIYHDRNVNTDLTDDAVKERNFNRQRYLGRLVDIGKYTDFTSMLSTVFDKSAIDEIFYDTQVSHTELDSLLKAQKNGSISKDDCISQWNNRMEKHLKDNQRQ